MHNNNSSRIGLLNKNDNSISSNYNVSSS